MSETPYQGLTPETILDAAEQLGYRTDGHLLALNSYENRVYQIGLEDTPPLIAKFYRPGRWSDAAIREEHEFSLALAAAEIPVIPPLATPAGETLHWFRGFRFALFPRHGGRRPDLEHPDQLVWLGRFLGRIHQLGAARGFCHRPAIDPQAMGLGSARFLLEHDHIPHELTWRYRELAETLQPMIEKRFHEAADCRWIRLHGDCHPGNILWTEAGPHFVDLDDCRTGPAIQDLWMLLSGERAEMALQLSYLREGYETFRPFDSRELVLIEPLRTLRLIHYAAWIARRWQDPAFPAAFPWFGSSQYWQQQISILEQQRAALEEPPFVTY